MWRLMGLLCSLENPSWIFLLLCLVICSARTIIDVDSYIMQSLGSIWIVILTPNHVNNSPHLILRSVRSKTLPAELVFTSRT